MKGSCFKRIILLMITVGLAVISAPHTNFAVELNNDIILLTEHSCYSHTKEQIINKYKESLPTYSGSDLYEEQPNSTDVPYIEGKVKDEIVQDTLKQINYYRWLAGFTDLTINDEWMKKSQRGALLLSVNDVFAHEQSKPEGMDEEMFNDGATACLTSNIAWCDAEGYLTESVLGYVDDSGNLLPNVGHRTHIFDIYGCSTSMGLCGNYSTIHVETSNTNPRK